MLRAMEKTATVIGSYRVVRVLGHGGMGTVYEVEDADGAHLALKLFTGGAKNRKFLEKRFCAEAKLLAALDHPHLVKVRDVGMDEATGNPWFTMDLVLNADGVPETLEDARRRGGILNEQALRWFRDLVGELDYLHAHGIVHRDVKLENVLIDSAGHAVLSDAPVMPSSPTSASHASSTTSCAIDWTSQPHSSRGRPPGHVPSWARISTLHPRYGPDDP